MSKVVIYKMKSVFVETVQKMLIKVLITSIVIVFAIYMFSDYDMGINNVINDINLKIDKINNDENIQKKNKIIENSNKMENVATVLGVAIVIFSIFLGIKNCMSHNAD